VDIRNVIKRPLVTEKASVAKEKDNKYTFVVDRAANKFQIKQAVEVLFKVKAEKVYTSNYLGKSKRVGRSSGFKNDWKKAVVKLAKGQEIKIADGV
jgi:large subunit ribosomal protein L23